MEEPITDRTRGEHFQSFTTSTLSATKGGKLWVTRDDTMTLDKDQYLLHILMSRQTRIPARLIQELGNVAMANRGSTA